MRITKLNDLQYDMHAYRFVTKFKSQHASTMATSLSYPGK
jgi:hypothetical protein